ncbi:MAG: VCBS repeat-containing protein, partial [Opitutaceae bacterium]|nr:VCBS repeat-containing protein [Verrucomicrobiales bacterium]
MWSLCLKVRALFAVACLLGVARGAQPPAELPRLAVNNPGLLADLGVGLWAWPLPMDFNGDGMMDLVVVCTGVPSNGIWYFENSGQI